MTLAITTSYTSPSENKSWNVPVSTESNGDNTQLQQLTDAIKSMQDNLNQYLTERMAADNEPATDLAQDEEEHDEEQGDDEDTGAGALQRRPDAPVTTNNKKQKTV
ncbi:hypothetical protein O0I10_010446 [Lichtheimia ornata]|uniref:EKC/KEOPS complex subunit GON7 n=1 Tax=Lichtheimia ornata TaxID=688661 RepID=A0AAD7UW08_9FUNG|nr:uncharacterized protein O0I10_010446 [Lichtheimia ornata]KAJ8653879.1 hypothetical protein O0I10_010446 [Lichtheimia ornata]